MKLLSRFPSSPCRAVAGLLALPFGAGLASERIDFVEDVRPILEEHCYECHGPDRQKSGLRLDIREAAFRGGSGHAPDIVPGDAGASPLVRFVSGTDPDLRMPPEGSPLSEAEVNTLVSWIEQGAAWPDGIDEAELEDKADHWSFRPVSRPETPPVKGSSWTRNGIDAFVLHRLEQEGIAPSPDADRATWLRRVTLDLTGLPPTPEELDAFLADPSESAYVTVIDRLLDSPRHGERWAQHWLDVVRYADTSGFETNTARPNAWPYRDWVIDALNRDMPYDGFIRAQIAGDALGENPATGFLVTSAVLLPGQIGKDEESKRLARQDELTEIVTNIGEAFLGVSIGCARCHDHKFDAISQEDFYSLQAFVSGVQFGERPDTDPGKEALRAGLREQTESLEKRIAEFAPRIAAGVARPPVNAAKNIERFEPVKAKRVRFTIESTILDDKREPFLDELEIFTPDGRNVALASRGAKAKDSGSSGKTLELVHDGVHGNESCWRAKEKGKGWVEIEFPEEVTIDRIAWGRDRTRKYADRLALDYRIEATDAAGEKRVVASSTDRARWTDGKSGPIDPASLPPADATRLAALEDELGKVAEERRILGVAERIYAGRFTDPEPISLLRRGDPEQPLSPVRPAVFEVLGDLELPDTTPDRERRRALADWIASPDHPLTARVIANRVWQWHFGTGLVETANDFGRAGTAPSHPELLDWLASELVRSGWSLHHLHRLIVLSRTYRQASLVRPEAAAADGDSRLLWRFPSRRLEAEAIRDSLLAVSGRLNLETGGSGFDLFRQRGGLSGYEPIEVAEKPQRRRMIYAHKIRMEREAVFGAFDCPDAGQSMPRRRQSTTPVQALNLFNSRFTWDESRALSERLDAEGLGDPDSRARRAWLLALGREPTAVEVADAAAVAAAHGWPATFRALLNSSEFVFLP